MLRLNLVGLGLTRECSDDKRIYNCYKHNSIVRSSAVEYLTFIAATGSGGVEAIYADKSIWLTQKMKAALYAVETQTINYHLKWYSQTVNWKKIQLFEIFE